MSRTTGVDNEKKTLHEADTRGVAIVAGEQLTCRDGTGIEVAQSVDFEVNEDCQQLLMDVPI